MQGKSSELWSRSPNEDPEIHSQATETTLENWLRAPCCQGWRVGSAEPRWSLLVSINKTNKQRCPNELRLRGEEGTGTGCPRCLWALGARGPSRDDIPPSHSCSAGTGGCHQHLPACPRVVWPLTFLLFYCGTKCSNPACVPLGWIFHSTLPGGHRDFVPWWLCLGVPTEVSSVLPWAWRGSPAPSPALPPWSQAGITPAPGCSQ